jgi:hypothetical protein
MKELKGEIIVNGQKASYRWWSKDENPIQVAHVEELKQQAEKLITQTMQMDSSYVNGILARYGLDGEVSYAGVWFCME